MISKPNLRNLFCNYCIDESIPSQNCSRWIRSSLSPLASPSSSFSESKLLISSRFGVITEVIKVKRKEQPSKLENVISHGFRVLFVFIFSTIDLPATLLISRRRYQTRRRKGENDDVILWV
ncbi:hypothetical protein NE237_012934 [Protea cynaroides]|uniref:Uncharacterized protein n=1 Tax=Protea cynaroides TaxID=273540 RepID=A0A9Q0GXP2_9MAGN|nr:hypothetical protein NE237_012934 [Protea cynaroides]